MDKRPIGVFDSGVGGITVVRHIHNLLPKESVVYLGDSANLPYGTKTPQQICEFTRENIRQLESYNVKYIIAACGTVSALFPWSESSKLSVPYTGIILPAARKVCSTTKTKEIALIGTEASVKSGAYQKEISKLMPDMKIHSIPCQDFVKLVESRKTSPKDRSVRTVAESYLKPLLGTNTDTLILGCTHFPFLKKVIQDIVGSSVTLVDPGEEAVNSVSAYLEKNKMQSENKKEDIFLTSGDAQEFSQKLSFYLGKSAPQRVKQIKKNSPSHDFKPVWIQIKSRFSAPGSEMNMAEETEFSAEGKLKEEDKTLYLSYSILLEGGKTSHTSMTIYSKMDKILIRTRGYQEYDLTLNKKETSVGIIKEGQMETHLDTFLKNIEGDLTKDGGNLLLKYDLLCGEMLLTHNEIEMTVKKKG